MQSVITSTSVGTHVIVRVENASDVLSEVTITHCLDVVTTVDYKHTHTHTDGRTSPTTTHRLYVVTTVDYKHRHSIITIKSG